MVVERCWSVTGFALLACALLAGCGGDDPAPAPEAQPPAQTAPAPAEPPPAPAKPEPQPEPEPEPAPAPAPAPAAPAASPPPGACKPGAYRRMRTQRVAHAAVVRSSAQAFRRPGRGPIVGFGPRNENGAPTVLGVLGRVVDRDCKPRWYRVQLPLKPNGVVGYVRVRDVELFPVRTRIVVELSQRRVTVYERGRKVLEAPAAIGSAATPTPVGFFYVNQRLRTADASGPFGPGAVGISAFSDVLTGWAQGGPVALHGTNRPDLIGQAVSNGCIRLRNDVLRRLFGLVRPGAPVVVRA